MGKLDHEIKKLSRQELAQLHAVLEQLDQGIFDLLQLKKLKGKKDMYRVRIGKMRIIYQVSPSGGIELLAVRKHSEKTYRDI